jgi:hypothetical protein
MRPDAPATRSAIFWLLRQGGAIANKWRPYSRDPLLPPICGDIQKLCTSHDSGNCTNLLTDTSRVPAWLRAGTEGDA